MNENTIKYIKKINNYREILKKKLDIYFYIGISLEGLSLLFLILFFCFISYLSLLFFFIISFISGFIVYFSAYFFFNRKYLASFKDELEISSIEENFKSYDFYKDKSITLDLIKKSNLVNTPDAFKGNDFFYFDTNSYDFISSKIELSYIHEEINKKNKQRIKDEYKFFFIRYSIKKDSLFYLSLINKKMPGEVIRNNRIGDEVYLDNPEFMKLFSIRTNDLIKARSLLNPATQKNLMDFFIAFKVDCSFIFDEHYLYVVSTRYNDYMKLNIYKKFDEKVFSSYSNEYLLPILIKDLFNDFFSK